MSRRSADAQAVSNASLAGAVLRSGLQRTDRGGIVPVGKHGYQPCSIQVYRADPSRRDLQALGEDAAGEVGQDDLFSLARA